MYSFYSNLGIYSIQLAYSVSIPQGCISSAKQLGYISYADNYSNLVLNFLAA